MEAKNIQTVNADHAGWHQNTELSVDVKTLLCNDSRLKAGKKYRGVLTLDAEAEADEYRYRDGHLTFTEMPPAPPAPRNPRVFDGRYITITREADGSLRPNFRRMKRDKGFTAEGYAFGVYRELGHALRGLLGENS